MKKIIRSVLLLLLVFMIGGAEAQKTKASKKEKVSKSSSTGSQHSDTTSAMETPPEIERLEDTKIDVVTNISSINFDTSSSPDDGFTKDIVRLLTITGALENDAKLAEQSLNMSLGDNDNEEIKEFKKRFLYEMKEGRARTWLTNLYIRTYRRLFTQAEIAELTVFYQTALGKKVTQNLPQLMQSILLESQKIGMYLGQKIMMEIRENNNQ